MTIKTELTVELNKDELMLAAARWVEEKTGYKVLLSESNMPDTKLLNDLRCYVRCVPPEFTGELLYETEAAVQAQIDEQNQLLAEAKGLDDVMGDNLVFSEK